MTPNYCHSCGNPLAEGNAFCPNCGAPNTPSIGAGLRATRNCPNCRRAEVGKGLFCLGCGQFLTAPAGVCAAGLGRRVAAYLLDGLIPAATIILLIVSFFAGLIVDFDDDTDQWGFAVLGIALLVSLLGYVVWWLIVLRRGQTPGKQLLGIRVVRTDGRASDWGWTFLREFGIKFIAISAVSFISGGIGTIVWIVDLLWAFWDRNHQALHDKIMKTVVIDDRAYRRAAAEEQRPEF